jgi:hypothetical protein
MGLAWRNNDKWPSCKLPMVGTNAGLENGAKCWRNSATVRAMNMDYQA